MLLTISPAPTSRTSDSATSVTTSAARRRRRPAPSEAVRAPSFNPSFTSVPTPYAAGARPEQNPGDRRDGKGEQQHGGIHADAIRPRQHPLADQIERVGRQIRDAECNGAASKREQEAFDEELSDQPGAGRTKRHTDGDLTLPDGGASKEQVRQVGAGDQQDDTRPPQAARTWRGGRRCLLPGRATAQPRSQFPG